MILCLGDDDTGILNGRVGPPKVVHIPNRSALRRGTVGGILHVLHCCVLEPWTRIWRECALISHFRWELHSVIWNFRTSRSHKSTTRIPSTSSICTVSCLRPPLTCHFRKQNCSTGPPGSRKRCEKKSINMGSDVQETKGFWACLAILQR